MDLFKTYDKDGFLRLEEDAGAALTLYLHRNCAYLISLIVPERDRRKGIGSALLSAAVDIISERGIERIETDFTKSLPGFSEFIEKNGFKTEDQAPVYSTDIDGLISSPVTINAMKKKVKGVSFSSLSKLSAMEWNALFSSIKGLGVYPTNPDFKSFDKEISGVVFDNEGEIKASVLCSHMEDGLLIELVSGDAKKNPGFILEALKGIITGLLEEHSNESLNTLSFIVSNDGVKGLLSTLEKGGLKLNGTDMCVSAMRPVKKSKKKSSALKVAEHIDESVENSWRHEIESIPFQKNISWKLPFSRGQSRD